MADKPKKWPVGQALCKQYRELCGESSILAVSCGKDSLSAALSIRDHINIVPIHYYIVPGLPLMEEALDYLERKVFHRKILRLPDMRFFDWLDIGTYQPLKHLQIMDAATMWRNPIREGGTAKWYNQVRKWITEDEKIDERTLIAVGVKEIDNPQRWMSFQKHGVIRPSSGAWYPIWDFRQDHLLSVIEKAGVKLPLDYHYFGKSFDRLSYEQLVPLKRNRPQDWKVVLQWYPLAEVEVWKYERRIEGKRA